MLTLTYLYEYKIPSDIAKTASFIINNHLIHRYIICTIVHLHFNILLLNKIYLSISGMGNTIILLIKRNLFHIRITYKP